MISGNLLVPEVPDVTAFTVQPSHALC